MKNRISILGCGWLGLPLAISLYSRGYEIKGSTTTVDKIEKLKSAGIIPFILDLNNIKSDITEFLASAILIIAVPLKNVNTYINLMSYI